MDEIAGWIAPIATTIAAIMTASNLGARVTGWGFVVFAVGSVAWIAVAFSTHQNNLLLTNLFLTLVNIFGIWRWLGRRAAYDEGAHAAEALSAQSPAPSLFQLGGIDGRAVSDQSGETVGHVVDVMAECDSGRISYFVVREGAEASVRDRLHAISWQDLRISPEHIQLASTEMLAEMPRIESDSWPSRAQPARG